ncbi:hypothetical protein [Tunicatimonas pelagia]|uniref:hypothetical protein n=1 Tax=Tunicatimonas pelagia TaxID=931531 RepID=UPI002666B626|nr:hypothetical protein [Tunicatimonas pelagia]WKN44823.1 hypothetical protein P0M28_07580 [Tunicatimonas pelagia]
MTYSIHIKTSLPFTSHEEKQAWLARMEAIGDKYHGIVAITTSVPPDKNATSLGDESTRGSMKNDHDRRNNE